MEQFAEGESTREEIKNKLRQNFDGKIVRKDLTKKIKEGANVPVYVLEFLLGQYCSSDDETVIEKGVQNVKRILADNFVRPDESQKILSQLRKKGSYTIIDMVTVRLDMKKDCFFAEFSNLGIGDHHHVVALLNDAGAAGDDDLAVPEGRRAGGGHCTGQRDPHPQRHQHHSGGRPRGGGHQCPN